MHLEMTYATYRHSVEALKRSRLLMLGGTWYTHMWSKMFCGQGMEACRETDVQFSRIRTEMSVVGNTLTLGIEYKIGYLFAAYVHQKSLRVIN